MSQTLTAPSAEQAFGLAGKTALVTGSNRGIGRGIAMRLAGLGARLVIAARSPGGEVVAQDIKAAGGEALHVPFDARDEASILAAVRKGADAFGGLDIVVNNAGVFPPTAIDQATAEELEDLHRVNVIGPYFVMREAAAVMRAGGRGGAIVNISSMGSVLPSAPSRFAYNATKAAVNRMTQDAAAAFARDRIRVNAVLPGPTDSAPEKVAALTDPAALQMREKILKKIPLRRWGTPEDMANAVAFLAGPSASFITGQLLVVDGGFTLG